MNTTLSYVSICARNLLRSGVLGVVILTACTDASAPIKNTSLSATPLHVLVLQDVSRSVDGLVPRLNQPDLEPVLDTIQERGGTVAFGSFGRVAHPFVRVVFTPPTTGKKSQNVFLRRPVEEEQVRHEYLAQALEQREAFLAKVDQLLEESASHTNLVAALSRAEVFFSETPRGAHKALVIVSDLVDTSGATSFELSLDPAVRLFLVSHSNREFGLLQDQTDRFQVFESVPAALRAVLED